MKTFSSELILYSNSSNSVHLLKLLVFQMFILFYTFQISQSFVPLMRSSSDIERLNL